MYPSSILFWKLFKMTPWSAYLVIVSGVGGFVDDSKVGGDSVWYARDDMRGNGGCYVAVCVNWYFCCSENFLLNKGIDREIFFKFSYFYNWEAWLYRYHIFTLFKYIYLCLKYKLRLEIQYFQLLLLCMCVCSGGYGRVNCDVTVRTFDTSFFY